MDLQQAGKAKISVRSRAFSLPSRPCDSLSIALVRQYRIAPAAMLIRSSAVLEAARLSSCRFETFDAQHLLDTIDKT